MKRIGMLTSGGDCPGLNATIRGAAKGCYQLFGEDDPDLLELENYLDACMTVLTEEKEKQ